MDMNIARQLEEEAGKMSRSRNDNDQQAVLRPLRPTFVSVYRINGQPILPPLMTDEKRKEMAKMRAAAVQRERMRGRSSVTLTDSASKIGDASVAVDKTIDDDVDDTSVSIHVELPDNSEQPVDGPTTTTASNDLPLLDRYAYENTSNMQLRPTRAVLNLGDDDSECPTESAKAEVWDSVFISKDKHFYNRVTPPVKPKSLALKEIPQIQVHPPTPASPPRNASSNISITINEIPSDPDGQWEEQVSANSPRRSAMASLIEQFEEKQQKPAATADYTIKTPRRSATMHSIKSAASEKAERRGAGHDSAGPPAGPISRSNSFTIETPSKALLDHMKREQQTTKPRPTTATSPYAISSRANPARDTVESRAKRVTKVEPKSRASPLSSRKLQDPAAKRLISKAAVKSHNKLSQPLKANLKQKPIGHCSTARAKANPAPVGQKVKSPKSPVLENNNLPAMSQEQYAFYQRLDAVNRDQFLRLLWMQQEETQQLKRALHERQKQQPQTNLPHKHQTDSDVSSLARSPTPPPPPVPPPPLESSLFGSPDRSYPFSMDGLTLESPSSRCEDSSCMTITPQSIGAKTRGEAQGSTRRRLFPAGPKAHEEYSEGTTKVISPTKPKRQSEIDKRHAAATIINAHVRGYLVRRLFQTEQIHRIVQTIRDTLIFVLNLHLESFENPDEANSATNIKLKARLLQQLSSASHTLYLVFFQTSVKERMEIIARDRKRIKTKITTMSMRRSFRT